MAIVAAFAVGSALVDVITVAGKATIGDVAAASIVDTSALHEAGVIEHGNLSSLDSLGGLGDIITKGYDLGGVTLGLDSNGEGEDGEKSEGLGEHFRKYSSGLIQGSKKYVLGP